MLSSTAALCSCHPEKINKFILRHLLALRRHCTAVEARDSRLKFAAGWLPRSYHRHSFEDCTAGLSVHTQNRSLRKRRYRTKSTSVPSFLQFLSPFVPPTELFSLESHTKCTLPVHHATNRRHIAYPPSATLWMARTLCGSDLGIA